MLAIFFRSMHSRLWGCWRVFMVRAVVHDIWVDGDGGKPERNHKHTSQEAPAVTNNTVLETVGDGIGRGDASERVPNLEGLESILALHTSGRRESTLGGEGIRLDERTGGAGDANRRCSSKRDGETRADKPIRGSA